MSPLVVAWSMCASAILMLGLIHLYFWFMNRKSPVFLLSSLMALSAGISALLELGMMLTHSIDTYGLLIRWVNLVVFMILVPMVWFIDSYFRSGRRWLAILITLLWCIGLLANFLSPHSLTFSHIDELKRMTTFWGESYSLPVGEENPWKYLVDFASLLILLYVTDASIRLWRRGERRRAMVTGGGIILFILLAGIHTPLVDAGVIPAPYMISFAFLAIVITMSYQFAVDAAQAKYYQQMLYQKQREIELISRSNLLGELSTTIAHELNQPLTAILSNAQAGQRILSSGAPDLSVVADILQDIERDDKRAGDLIHRLRALLNTGKILIEPVDINTVITEVLDMLGSDLDGQQVEIVLDLDQGQPVVASGRIEIKQVLINLIMNALKAMQDTPPKQRQIIMSSSCMDSTVQVVVSDSGSGIPEENLSRIFEAFFFNKSGGLGMGLAICKRILEACGGEIYAESSVNQGATFVFSLPVYRQAQE